jgi:hypothetical protein
MTHHSPIWLARKVSSLALTEVGGSKPPEAIIFFELANIGKLWGATWHPLIMAHVTL